MKISRYGGYGVFEPDSNQPRDRSEGPYKTHTGANHSNCFVQPFVPEVIERLGKRKLTHDVKSEPAKTFIGNNRLWSMLCDDFLKLASKTFDLILV